MLDLLETRCSVWFAICCIANICMTDMASLISFFFWFYISLLSCFHGISAKSSKQYYFKFPEKYFSVNHIQDGSFWAAHGSGCKNAHLHKICHTYPKMMKLGTVIPYLTKIQNIYKSRDTPINFCWHPYFFTKNHQLISRNTDIDCSSIHNC